MVVLNNVVGSGGWGKAVNHCLYMSASSVLGSLICITMDKLEHNEKGWGEGDSDYSDIDLLHLVAYLGFEIL